MEAVLNLLSAPGSLKLVRPKALLDNCFRVMELLSTALAVRSSEGLGLGLGYRCLSQVTRQSWGRSARPLLPRATGHFWKWRWTCVHEEQCGLVGVRGY